MKSKRLLILLLLALLVPWAANAQTVTIGDGTSTDYYSPIGTFHNYSFSEQLYTPTEINQTGYIVSIAFDYAGTVFDKDFPIVVYMKAVDNQNLSDGMISLAATDEVFNGTLSVTAAGWATINLDKAFSYDGTKNLLIAVDKQYLKWYSNGNWNHTAASNMTRSIVDDNTNTDPLTMSASTGTVRANRPNVQLTFGTPSTCPKPTLNEVDPEDITATTATVRWTSEVTGQAFDLYWSTNSTLPENAEPMATAAAGATSYQITGLNPATRYYVWLRGNCGDETKGWTSSKNFMTDCAAINVGYTCGFEGPNTGGTASYPLPACWSRPTGTSSYYPYVNSYGYHDGSHSLCFYGSASSTQQIAVMPEINGGVNGKRLSLYAKLSSTSASGGLSVGYMTDPNNASTYREVAPLTLTTSYPETPYKVDFSGIEGNPVYMAIKSTLTNSYNIYVDDVALSNTPSCIEPSGLAEVPNTATSNSLQLTWTPVSSETHWKVQYKKSEATDWTTVEVAQSDLVNGAYTLGGLDASSAYNVRVAAWCGYPGTAAEDMSEYSAPITLNTTCPAVTTFPWTEDFEGYSAGNFSDPCWVNEHISGEGTNIFKVYTSTNGTNSTHQLQLPDQTAGTQTKLRLPEMNLPSNNYQFVIDIYRTSNTYQSYPYQLEGIHVYASTNGELEGATKLAYIPRHYEVGNDTIPAESTTGWYTYELPIGIQGSCYIILVGVNQYCTSTYMDNFAVEQIPTCKRPSALMLETPSSRTAHSATLKWTNGSDDQTAWQIAYSTASNFNPDTVTTIVNVNTNPDTLTGLDQNTTYYAYVRANCGGGDNSSWSTAKATFKTLEGNKKPTNLAYDPATLTSSSVRVNWKGVATNELHMYYELYYDTLSTRPNPLVAENLKIVQGEIDTTYLLEGLQAEKKYYVWVRDTCGTDGYSDWTSSINFTTASACQTPDGLAANDVTINSASITWNTYGQTGFNLRYRALGEEWTDKNSVSTPCPLTGLTPNTPYQVLVQRTCNTEVWSDTLNFRTDCTPKTITETDFINEGFEDYVGTTYNTAGVVPYCWDNYSTSATYPYPHIVGSGSYYYVHGGTKSLNFESDYGHATYVALPEFTNDLNTLQVSFWMRMENASQGYLTLGYITAEDVNYNTYTVIDSCQRSSSMVQNMLYLALKNVPSTATRLVFKWIYEGNNYYACCIDDVVVKLAPSCIPVKTFATSNVKAHSVDLAWTLYDETQTSFDVQYSVSQNFTEGDSTFINNGVSLTEGKYVLSGLTHDTTYYVRVRANCGGGEVSPWSDSKRVVTPAGNQAPSTFAIVSGSEGPHYVSLVWNQGGELAESWDLYYVKSETAPEEAPTVATPATVTVNTLPTAEAPYLLEGLDAESRYYIWVRANCGIDGLSAWKALTGSCFTTLEACPMPVNGEVTNMTPVSAQLNWTGYAENYNVQYRTAAYSYPAEGSFFEDFESGTLNGWTVIRGGEGNTSTDWMAFDGNFGNGIVPAHSGTYVARSRSYAGNGYHVDNWLISPQLTLNGQLNYWARGNASYPEHYEVYVSTTTSDTTAFTLLYTPSTVTGEWVEHTVDLSTFAGQQGYIAFRNTDYDKDYLFIDDVLVGTKVTVEAGAWSASIPAVGDSLVIERLSPETAYEWKVQAVCGGEDGSSLWSDSTSFTTPSACDAPVNLAATNETYNSATLSWSNYQETYNLRYRTAADADIYLEDSFEDGELGDWTVNLTSTSTYENGVQEGYFAFAYTYNPPQYLISPLLDENGVVEGSTLFFQYEGSDDDSPETFQVGYSSTTNDVSAFTWGNTITIGEDEDVYSQTIPAGTKYFAIKHTAYDAYWLYLWNFYAFGPVTPAGEWVDVEGPVENPYTLTGLNPDTPYEFQVQGNNTSCEGDTTAWSQIGWFETLPLPTQTIALIRGSNYVSFYVETNLNDLKAALVEVYPSDTISIKSKNQTHTYIPRTHRWSGSFAQLDMSKMYIINVVSTGEITLKGVPVDPAEHPITINHGSNYLGFPFDENMTLTNAFAGFAQNGDKIKTKNETCPYNRGRWGNQISTLEPGKGYIYVGADNQGDGRNFVYPTSNRGAQETVQTPKVHIFPDASKATLKAMPMSKIDKKASKSMKALDKKDIFPLNKKTNN